MIRFNNDYNRSCHPSILKALQENEEGSYDGYGKDIWCEKAAKAIKKHLNCDNAEIHFVVGGTQANYIGIDFLLKPWEGVLCAETGHIHVHETGAVEHIGRKCLTLPAQEGKISATQIDEAATLYEKSDIPEHVVQPRMVYLSQPTELGTLYSKNELSAIEAVCAQHDLYLFIDGARMGYGLGSAEADFTLIDIAAAADMFTIGGTKCGALFGEAVVITKPALQNHYRSALKQNGGLLAKGWLLGMQFSALFENDLYFTITREANIQAARIREAFARKGIKRFVSSPTNQQFFVLSDHHMKELEKNFSFMFDHAEAPDQNVCRFCTSWATTNEEVDALVEAIDKL